MKKIVSKLLGAYLNLLALVAPRYAARVGLALFCRPFRGKITNRQKEFLQSGYSFEFDFQTEKIKTYHWGNGSKKVLLIHGWQSHSYRWKVYVDELIKHDYTVLAFDAPGHGLSTGNFLSVPLYGEVLEKMILQIGKLDAIVAHSIGGFSILYTLYHNPPLSPDKLVIMAAPGEAQEFFDFYKATLGLSKKSSDLVSAHFTERFDRKPEYFSAPKFASAIKVPGLIIHDEGDDETSAAHSSRIHKQWTNSKLWITKGFGHNLKSLEVVKEVVAFVDKESPIEPTTELLSQVQDS